VIKHTFRLDTPLYVSCFDATRLYAKGDHVNLPSPGDGYSRYEVVAVYSTGAEQIVWVRPEGYLELEEWYDECNGVRYRLNPSGEVSYGSGTCHITLEPSIGLQVLARRVRHLLKNTQKGQCT